MIYDDNLMIDYTKEFFFLNRVCKIITVLSLFLLQSVSILYCNPLSDRYEKTKKTDGNELVHDGKNTGCFDPIDSDTDHK